MALTGKGGFTRPFEPELWSAYVRFFFSKGLHATRHFTDFSSEFSGGGERVHIPFIDVGPSTTSLTTSTGDLTDNLVTDTSTNLIINKWEATSIRFTDYQMKQIASKYSILAKYAEQSAYGLGLKVDADLLSNAHTDLQRRVNDSSTAITATDLRSAMSIVDSYSVPRDQLLLILEPGTYWDLMRNNQIYDASIFGRGAPQAEGVHDYIFGVPVAMTTNLPKHGIGDASDVSLLVHKEAIAYAFAGDSGPRLQMKEAGEALAQRLVADVMYGHKIMNQYGGCKIISTTRY